MLYLFSGGRLGEENLVYFVSVPRFTASNIARLQLLLVVHVIE